MKNMHNILREIKNVKSKKEKNMAMYRYGDILACAPMLRQLQYVDFCLRCLYFPSPWVRLRFRTKRNRWTGSHGLVRCGSVNGIREPWNWNRWKGKGKEIW